MRSSALAIILLLALLVRGALMAATLDGPGGAFTPDSHSYWQLSRSLLERGAFARDDTPEIFRTPGYPAFLAVGRLLGGWRTAVGLQVVLDTLLVGLTYLLARQLVGHRTGLLAAALQAVSPVAVAASCRVLSDSFYALLLTGAVVAMLHHFRSRRWVPLLLAALLLAAACYVRPMGIAMAAVMAAVLLFRRGGLLRTAAFLAVVAACLAPWVARNAMVAELKGFSSFAGDSLYRFSAAEVLARHQGRDAEAVRRRLDDQAQASGTTTPGQLARFRRRRAMDVLAAHRGSFLWTHLTGAGAFWLPGATDVLEVAHVTTGQKGTLAVLHRQGLVAAVRHYFRTGHWAIWLAAPMVLLYLVKLLGGLVCVVGKARWGGVSAGAWLMLLVVAVSALAGGVATTPRFRVSVEPILSVAAASGLAMVAAWFGWRLRRGGQAAAQAEAT